MDRMTEEALCEVQAQLYALRVAMRAIARSHPDPVALLATWREALIEVQTCNPVAPTGWRSSDYLAEQMHACAEDWTAELVELAVPSADFPLETTEITAPSADEQSRSQPRSK